LGALSFVHFSRWIDQKEAIFQQSHPHTQPYHLCFSFHSDSIPQMSLSVILSPTPSTTQRFAKVNIIPLQKTAGAKRSQSQSDMPAERVVKKRQRTDSHDDNGKKQRGRPRVEGEDETAADVCLS
jgi:hypothetical protein